MNLAMVESSDVASSNSRRLSPTGTMTSRTFSCSTVSSGEMLRPSFCRFPLPARGTLRRSRDDRSETSHTHLPNKLLDKRVRIALVLGDFSRVLLDLSIAQFGAGLLEHGVAQHL